jgi:serine/threonine-protein kinase
MLVATEDGAAVVHSESTLEGRYRLDRLIDQGGMAFIYAGTHLLLDRPVAIKILRPRFSERADAVDRFLREARAAVRVSHEHVVEVLDFGIGAGREVFVVMELLEGENFAMTLRREGPMPWRRVRHIASQLCNALAAVHAAGIVHRDVTLANCFRMCRGADSDFVKLVDFGIALVPDTSGAREARLTTEADVFGTPGFIAPEQAVHTTDADARSDIYSVGVVLYSMLAGRLPFAAHGVADLLQQQLYESPVPPRRFQSSIPAAVEAMLLRALEKDPSRRFQSMSEFCEEIRTIPPNDDVASSPPPVTKRGWRIEGPERALLLAGVLVCIALCLAFS